jgi:MFS family permease
MTEQAPAINLGRAKLLLGFGMLMFAIGQSLTFVIVAPLARRVGFTEQDFGIALTLASLPLIVGAPFWGRRSESMGRRNVFVIGVTGASVGTLLIALVLQAGLNGWMTGMGLLALFALARASYGAVASAIYPSSTAYMVDVTDVSNRASGLAIIGAANGMGSIFGPLMAAGLAGFGPLVPMYVAVLIGLAGAAFTLLYLPEPERHADSRRPSTIRAGDRRLRPFMVAWGTFFLTFMSLQIVLAFYLQDEFGIAEPKALVRISSLMLMSMALMIVLVQTVVLQTIRIRPLTLLRWMGPLFVVALVIMMVAPGPLVMGIGFAVLGLSFACANPGINGTASMSVEAWEQGAAMGYLSAANTVGAILGPLVGTQLYHRLGHEGPMLAGAIAMAAVSVYVMSIRVPERKRPPPAADPAPAPVD